LAVGEIEISTTVAALDDMISEEAHAGATTVLALAHTTSAIDHCLRPLTMRDRAVVWITRLDVRGSDASIQHAEARFDVPDHLMMIPSVPSHWRSSAVYPQPSMKIARRLPVLRCCSYRQHPDWRTMTQGKRDLSHPSMSVSVSSQ
jgi:hypothetical protein